MNPYMKQYRTNQVQTATPEQILIMLYDGAIRFCREADNAIVENNYSVRGEKIGRVLAILNELTVTLDRKIGGEMAENLDALYAYMMRRLTHANIKSDRAALKEVTDMLADLRETWMQAIEIARREKAAAQAAVPQQAGQKRVAVAS